MDVGTDIFGIVKTNKKGFCKDTTENMTNYWSRVSYLMLNIKTSVHGDRLIIVIRYKYASPKIPHFFATYGAGITKSGFT